MDDGIRYSKEDDGYKAVRYDFINDEQSPFGYGPTMAAAGKALEEAEAREAPVESPAEPAEDPPAEGAEEEVNGKSHAADDGIKYSKESGVGLVGAYSGYMATRYDFINKKVSPYGLGDTKEQAAERLIVAEKQSAGKSTANIVLKDTGEVIDFGQISTAIEGMVPEERGQLWVELVQSGVLGGIMGQLKNGLIDHMRDIKATKMNVPQGEITLTSSKSTTYNIDEIKKLVPDAIKVSESIDKRMVTTAKKQGGNLLAEIEAAATVHEPSFSLSFKAKPIAEVEK